MRMRTMRALLVTACLSAATAAYANGNAPIDALLDQYHWTRQAQFARRGDNASIVATGAGAAMADQPYYAQARHALDRIVAVLSEHGLSARDVVRTRIYLTDIAQSAQIARAHKETFDDARPVIAMVQTRELSQGVLVAIHAEVVAGAGEPARTGRGGKMEESFGHSVVVQRGGHGAVTGLNGLDADGRIPAGHGPREQMRTALTKLADILGALGRDVSEVSRTRLYVTDIAALGQYAEVHREVFGAQPPATTVIEVDRLFAPEMTLELDADFATGDILRMHGGSRWEPWFGFSRSVRADRAILVSGTTAEGADSAAQAEGIVESLTRALGRGGAAWADVHHLNVIHRDGADLSALARTLDRVLGENRPTVMPLRVTRLAGDSMLFDVDAEARLAR